MPKRSLNWLHAVKRQKCRGTGISGSSFYHCSSTNEYKKSLDCTQRGIDLLSSAQRTYYLPYYHLNRGRCFQFMGDQIRAQEEYLDAISILEKRTGLLKKPAGWAPVITMLISCSTREAWSSAAKIFWKKHICCISRSMTNQDSATAIILMPASITRRRIT